MLVGNWMSRDLVTVTPDTSMMRASKIMKDANVRGLSVIDENGRLMGVVTDRDLKEASPSKATTLDVHELYYLLSEIKVKDIMSTKLVTVTPQDSVEKAAVLLQRHKIGGLPVVEGDNVLVGVITQSDVFDVLISITGVLHGGFQFGIELPDERGTMAALVEFLNSHEARIMSILTSYEPEGAPTRRVFVRVQDMDKALQKVMLEDLGNRYKVLYILREDVHHIAAEQ
ncbi:acetoin utilization protein AcuB [Desulfobaculum xiamenense]|uniref:Acetoin utilization protein AcuB n=1 Tax=Desulfobaculum xiamenense TaxID=995050 RepID=A0A846QQL1_9BACT|nr:CBS and ACT domain-containing protein [Desulfobaculum xiamenense]NJB68643.1 acetoin utilization protein AcuB [Desulfobaculum xiamenense]